MADTISLTGKNIKTNQNMKIILTDGQVKRVETDLSGQDSGLFLAPGFVDLQINGYAGIDFNTEALTLEQMQEVCHKLAARGVTTFYPTVITNSIEQIQVIVSSIAKARQADPLIADMIPGIHLEGPFISPQDGARGAHDKQFIKAPNWPDFDRIQEAAQGLIKILTLSPEWPEAPEFVRQCVQTGVKVSIGHTMATGDQIQACVEAGASMSTHLGNGAPAMLARHPNFIWDQLANDQLTAGVIGDGFHLPIPVLKTFLRAKRDQIFLVSDAVAFSGYPPGQYHAHIGGDVILTPEGRLCTAEDTRLLAGSVKILPEQVNTLLEAELIDIPQAFHLASEKPAEFIGLTDRGHIGEGAKADLILFSRQGRQIKIEAVYKAGRKIQENFN